MRKDFLRKGMVLGIICLFIGAGVVPSAIGNKPIFGTIINTDDGNKPEIVYIRWSWESQDNVDEDEYVIKHNLKLNWTYDAFNDINKGITHILDNGSVIVLNGTYYTEKTTIDINKPLTLTGEDKDGTIIDGCGNANVVGVRASNVDITNFTICNSKKEYRYAGIQIYKNSEHVKICNCILEDNGEGICVSVTDRSNYLFIW